MKFSAMYRKAAYLGAVLFLFAGAAHADVPPPRGSVSPEWVKKTVAEEATRMGVPPDLALAVAKVESGFQANAHSNKGARGIMQIMPSTAWEWYGLPADELWDPETNIRTGVRHLSDLHAAFGSWDLALVGYYAGPGVARAGMNRASADVRRYVAAVQGNRSSFGGSAEEFQVASASPVSRPAVTAETWSVQPSGRIQAARHRPADADLLAGPAYPTARAERIWSAMNQW